MLRKLLLACVVFIVVGLLLVYLIGPLFVTMAIPFIAVLGHFLIQWGWLLALAAAIWFYFTERVL